MSKSAIVRLSAGIFLLGGVWLAFTQNPNQPARLDSIKVKDDLYVIHNDFVPGNTTALITDAGVLLVDDKFEVDHSNIMAEVKKITSQPVKYVVNTHHHADHSGGNRAMQKMDVEVVSSEQARENRWMQSSPAFPRSPLSMMRSSISVARPWSCISSAAHIPTATWWSIFPRTARWRQVICSLSVVMSPN